MILGITRQAKFNFHCSMARFSCDDSVKIGPATAGPYLLSVLTAQSVTDPLS
jgi:hypothetical protein